ncbi:hypothetical protein [Nocardioides sp. CER19]|uniref:hypothetical protein n=1 Tax=Nocardioides sp. CER19 TaxID=3038538 RepID=UPI00244D1749|nr:hypothetical protein [Nocardioides sp. CER19]MDH2413866.1 hypothetical protein [Nocardioides sp. CER19]
MNDVQRRARTSEPIDRLRKATPDERDELVEAFAVTSMPVARAIAHRAAPAGAASADALDAASTLRGGPHPAGDRRRARMSQYHVSRLLSRCLEQLRELMIEPA